MSRVVVNDRSRAALRKVRDLAKDGVRDFLETVVERSKDTSPFDTGNLRDSIEFDEPGDGKWRLFTGTGYGGFVHEGTAHIAARPWIATEIQSAIHGITGRRFRD